MLKYVLINILHTKRMYIPLFIILALLELAFMYIFSLRTNIVSAHEQHASEYVAIAIVDTGPPPTLSSEIAAMHSNPLYVSDYYAFNEHIVGSDALESAADMYSETGQIDKINDFVLEWSPFKLMVYSDMEKSTHFRLGDRMMKEGRFAENTSECNIGAQLAERNSLTVGDTIEIFADHGIKLYYEFEIVGVFEDNTELITNELSLLNSKRVSPGGSIDASYKDFTRNQILTVARTSNDETFIPPWANITSPTPTYKVLVYYTHDQNALLAYAEELMAVFPEPQYVILDTEDTLRIALDASEKISNIYLRFLVAASLISLAFCSLIIYYIHKDRTYDIGALRARGMSRAKVSALFATETLAISMLAFAVSPLLFYKTFSRLCQFYFDKQFTLESLNYFGIAFASEDNSLSLINHTFYASLTAHQFILVFLFTSIISIAAGLFSAMLLSRHEPIKTMTEH